MGLLHIPKAAKDFGNKNVPDEKEHIGMELDHQIPCSLQIKWYWTLESRQAGKKLIGELLKTVYSKKGFKI
ncbi:hypothetical protein GN956_G18298 [Arapaima gigas]